MRVVLTLLVRDEADIVDAHLAFHFAAGVDFVIATDHRSGDGTSEVLEPYAREGVLRVIREESQDGAAGRVADADGASRGDGARRRLGDPQRRRRVLVAARPARSPRHWPRSRRSTASCARLRGTSFRPTTTTAGSATG